MTKTEKLREKIDLIFDGCYSKDLSASSNHTIFQRGKAVNEILPLIEEAEKQGKRKALRWALRTSKYSSPYELIRDIKQALREEKSNE